MEAKEITARLKLPLLPSLTSPLPLPEDRPVWRSRSVSFLILYYNKSRRRSFNDTRKFIRRLHDCTHGNRGDGQLGANATSEVIVIVDSRGEGEQWDAVVDEFGGRAQGSFVTVLLSDNYHEVCAGKATHHVCLAVVERRLTVCCSPR